MQNTVTLGSVEVGANHPTLLMPEIGTYFNQDFDQAESVIRAVKDAGLSVVKGEVFHTPDIVLNDGFELTYATAHGVAKESYYDIIARKVSPFPVWRDLYAMCTDLGLSFVVSAYDCETVDFLADIGCACIKLAGSNLTHVPLLRCAAETGLPVMLDARACTFSDIVLALETLDKADCNQVILNHSADGSPAPAEAHNLLTVDMFRQAFGCPVGLSCHYADADMLIAATALGYDILEKPVCIDPTIDDVDTPWAAPVASLNVLAKRVEAAWNARGNPDARSFMDRPVDPARQGAVAKQALRAGDIVQASSVRFAWPCHGVETRDWDRLDGMKLMRDVAEGAPIGWADVGLDD
jgi:sialic acid synthase SpsE